MRRRRNIEAFSLSFLDCICCGFGAIILLLVLSKIYEPVIIEKTQDDLESLIKRLAAAPLNYQPGKAWQYSAATDVVGRLVEVISGIPLDQYMQDLMKGSEWKVGKDL